MVKLGVAGSSPALAEDLGIVLKLPGIFAQTSVAKRLEGVRKTRRRGGVKGVSLIDTRSRRQSPEQVSTARAQSKMPRGGWCNHNRLTIRFASKI